MSGVIAESLVAANCEVTLVTPRSLVSSWTENTLEQEKIQARLLNLGVNIVANHKLQTWHRDHAELSCVFTGRTQTVTPGSLVLVTARDAREELFDGMQRQRDCGTITRIGDCYAPGTVAAAVYAGHRFARGSFKNRVNMSNSTCSIARSRSYSTTAMASAGQRHEHGRTRIRKRVSNAKDQSRRPAGRKHPHQRI